MEAEMPFSENALVSEALSFLGLERPCKALGENPSLQPLGRKSDFCRMCAHQIPDLLCLHVSLLHICKSFAFMGAFAMEIFF